MLNTMANKLELSDTVVTKAMEYRRLTDVKCSVLSKRYSDNCICVVCLQLASKSLGAEFDEVKAARLSGLSRKAYSNAVQSVEKLLQLEPVVSIKELSVKMECVEVEPLARSILERYCQVVRKEVGPVRENDLDFTKTKYSVAALYTAAKLNKVRMNKSKFLSIPSCSRKEFQSIVDVMTENVPSGDDSQEKDAETLMEETTQTDGVPVKKLRRERLQDKAMCSPCDEEYLSWKKRIIEQAEAALNNSCCRKSKT